MKRSIAKYIEKHGLDRLILPESHKPLGVNEAVDPSHTTPYAPEWDDLIRLHALMLERRITTVLEFGCGYSTLIMAHALSVNARKHGSFVSSNLRRHNPFEIHTVDDMPEYLASTREKIPEDLRSHVHFHETGVAMTTFNGRIATEYGTLPNICPDFIYLDGPSQHSVKGDIGGITTAHPDRLPMACDLLKMEHFLLPGTLILVDGRTANARFLQTNFQRGWRHRHDKKGDVHLFELTEPPLGPYNKRQIDYCLGKGWLKKTR